MPFTPDIQKLIEESITLYRQPIANLRTGEISHYEILSRFKSGDSLHSPLEFVNWLEEHGLIGFLDRFAIAQTLEHITKTGDRDVYAINLSAQTINQNGQFSKFLAIQKALHGLENLPIIFEITERISVSNTAIAHSVLSFIRAIGCPLAVDDFGAPGGSFNVASLDILKPGHLKIDGWYTKRLSEPATQARAIADINAYCNMASVRGIKAILEQVEPEQVEAVRTLTEIDLIQGYAVGKPEILARNA